MTTSNRAALLTKLHKVLKKHYKPIEPVSTRTVLEHLLYAGCLENSKYQEADDAFARLQQSYFDWNEVRVTTVSELAETLGDLPHAQAAAANLKRSLQGIFEALFSFDLELMKKQNLGKSEQDLAKYLGDAPFIVSYVAQHGLGGHSIPCGQAEIDLLYVVGAMSEHEYDKRQVPGMERAIPKNKGVEFSSLLHQLASDFMASPNSTRVKTILLEIDAAAKDRLASLAQKKLAPPPVPAAKSKETMENEKLIEATAKAKALAEKHRAQKAEAQEKKRTDAMPPAKPGKSESGKSESPKKKDEKQEKHDKERRDKDKHEKDKHDKSKHDKHAPSKSSAAKKPSSQEGKKLAKKKPR